MVLPQILKAIQTLTQAQASQELEGLRKVLTQQSLFLLDKIDAAYESDNPYPFSSQSLEGWRGEGGQLFQAFGATNPGDLSQNLSLQRDRLLYIAKEYIEPLIQLLKALQTSPFRMAPLFKKWSAILDQLDAHGEEKPNSLSDLENFILQTLPSLTLSNCPVALMEGQEGAANYFTKKLETIRQCLGVQCLRANQKSSATAYRKIAVFFQKKLMGRYPFVPPGMQNAPDVSLEDLEEFFTLFDAQAPYALEALEKHNRADPAVSEARRFIKRLTKLRAFFKPFLRAGDDPQDPPSVPLTLTFRANQSREVQGNQIMWWRLEMSGVTYPHTQKAKAFWVYDTPIKLNLRWALGSPFRPVDSKRFPNLEVDSLNATYVYDGPWALLKLLQAHQTYASDFDGGTDPNPTTLRFDIPIVLKDEVRATAAPPDVPSEKRLLFTRVFMGIQGPLPFKIPPIPFQAPGASFLQQNTKK
jgi:type VI secretion system protein ImpL